MFPNTRFLQSHHWFNWCIDAEQTTYASIWTTENPNNWLHRLLLNYELTHWVMPIYVNKLTVIGSDNVLSPGQWQAIIWTIAGILLTGPLGINFNGILIKMQHFSFLKMHWKMSSGKWRSGCDNIFYNILLKWHKYPDGPWWHATR